MRSSRSGLARSSTEGAGVMPTPIRQVPASSIATVEITDQTVTEIWSELLDHQAV